jgi:hypothetical protein
MSTQLFCSRSRFVYALLACSLALNKTGFISGEIPFLPGDRDTTVPVTQCNGLCHVTPHARHARRWLPRPRRVGTHERAQYPRELMLDTP